MGDYQANTDITASADDVFDYLSDVSQLPKYFERMTSAEPGDGEEVHVVADLGDRTVEGDAWFRVDHDAHSLAWGSEGPNDYRGTLEVSGGTDSCTVTVTLTTTRAEGPQIQQGLEETLANVKRLTDRSEN
ncbi:MAG: SRPBCC family protein [Jatrophihabitans sp.]